MRSVVVALALLALLGGCAGTPPQRAQPFAGWKSGADPAVAACADLFARLDDAIDAAGVRDGAAVRIAGFPHLRTDRFLADEARRADREAPSLLASMRSLDRTARAYEIANLPEQWLARFGTADATTLVEAVETCGALLLAQTTHEAADRARVPDDYDTWKRYAGVYALTRLPFAAGVRGYQQDTVRTFALPLEALPVSGALVRHGLPAPAATPLGLAALAPFRDPPPEGLASWFARYAPILEIDTASDADLPGQPILTAEGRVDADVSRPVLTTRLAHTRFAGQVLPQLVYSVWFPAHPRKGTFDLLGGRLDGITWRVTLGPDGTPWLYDSIHNCGCYHQFFPTPAVRLKPLSGGLDEGAFVPESLPAVPPGARIVLRVAADTHDLQRVTVEQTPESGSPLVLVADDVLRSLPDPRGGRRSLFRPDGIVAGTERGERWLFWPMGVREPGAMRQWGRHATAFVGRRHFDEARLIDRYFEIAR